MTAQQKNEILRLRAQGVDYAGIAGQMGMPTNTVKTFCWRYQQTAAKPVDPFKDVPPGQCPQCGIMIDQVPRQKPRRFCCDQCRRAWWNANRNLMKHRSNYITVCSYCGVRFDHRGDTKRRYCSHSHYIAARFGGEPS